MSNSHDARHTVLLVDDSELACESVKHTLSKAGCEVVALNSPFGFIRAIRESSPNVILLDVGLGSVNGTKLVQLARQHSPGNCPVLLYSGRDATALAQDAADSGADGFISKETTGQAFVNEMHRWLSASGARPGGRPT